MLSEQVFEHFTRDAPLTQTLVEEAWPDLAVESKLQIIHAHQSNFYRGTPSWLMLLAISDNAAIVRYWAASHYKFIDEKDRPSLFGPVDEFEKELLAKAVGDSSKLVKACLDSNPWEKECRLERLIFIRNHGTPRLVSGLNKAFDNGLSDADLAESFRELIAKKDVLNEMKFDGDYEELSDAYHEGAVVTDGWALVAKAGPQLRLMLAHYLPTSRGLGHISAEELAAMPSETLQTLAYRVAKTRETEEVLELVISNPEKYGKAVVDAVKEAVTNNAKSSLERLQNEVLPTSQEFHEETMEKVDSLSEQIRNLTEQLSLLQQQITAKKGLFL